ncbi:haloacid dehalogenase type II [Coraliomargarita sp. W4R53]
MMKIPQTIAFDVYGTLVDPVEMGKELGSLIGDRAEAFGRLWNDKKLEYAFRRGLMDQYQDFGVCTQQALRYCLQVFGLEMTEVEQHALLAKFSQLEAFPDVIAGLLALKAQGHRLVAFSNGPESAVRTLLENAKVLPHMETVISVDDLKTFKPNPSVYEYVLQRTGAQAANCWLISSNPWDVIGGKAAGLQAAWVQRDPAKVFDPWEFQPDRVVRDLNALSQSFA